MIWIALGFALTVWAGVAAYGIWCLRADRRAERAETRATQERTEKSFDRVQALIKHWASVRETPSPADFPAEGDNFTTLATDNVTRGVEFGKKPRTDTPDGVA